MATTTGDAIPDGASIIEVHVADVQQLFNSLDPAPFRDRDLDPKAEEFIVEWGRELPHEAQLALRVHLDRAQVLENETQILRNAIHRFFHDRSASRRLQLRQLLRRGRISLGIGLAFLAASITASQMVEDWALGGNLADILRESMLIGGWVAMWRPLEIFLYDWWPVRGEARLLARLSTMPVQVICRP